MEILDIFGLSQDWSVSTDGSSLDDPESHHRLDWRSDDEDEELELMYAQRKHRSEQRKLQALTGRRRRPRTQLGARSPADILLGCANIQIECCAWGDDPLPVLRYRKQDMFEPDKDIRDQVVVAVETTAICGIDLAMRRGALNDHIPFPFVLGSNFVGIVHHAGLEAYEFGIKKGDRVAAITKWGSNSKYVSISAENLIVVPKHLDSADMACVISNYLPAFQMLHHGRARPYRYTRTCLKGRRILVTGGAALEVQALIRMAHYAGATEIYVTAPLDHHEILEKKDVVVLSDDPNNWLRAVRGRMDIVVDYAFPKHFSSVRAALAPKGRLVCNSPKTSASERNWMSDLDFVYEYSLLAMMKRATLFDFIANVEVLDDDTEEDFHFLITLLSSRQLRPNIDRFIKLKDVPNAHEEIETKPLTGTIICEPWKE